MSHFFVGFKTYRPKIGCYRLPTHRRIAHRKFFIITSYFKIEILVFTYTIVTYVQEMVNIYIYIFLWNSENITIRKSN